MKKKIALCSLVAVLVVGIVGFAIYQHNKPEPIPDEIITAIKGHQFQTKDPSSYCICGDIIVFTSKTTSDMPVVLYSYNAKNSYGAYTGLSEVEIWMSSAKTFAMEEGDWLFGDLRRTLNKGIESGSGPLFEKFESGEFTLDTYSGKQAAKQLGCEWMG